MPIPNPDMINEPDPSRLINGLRDTGYDFYTAVADIVDNSIAADASNVNINIEIAPDGRKYVYFEMMATEWMKLASITLCAMAPKLGKI